MNGVQEKFENAIDELWPTVLFDWQLFEGEYVGELEQDYLKIWQASRAVALDEAAALLNEMAYLHARDAILALKEGRWDEQAMPAE